VVAGSDGEERREKEDGRRRAGEEGRVKKDGRRTREGRTNGGRTDRRTEGRADGRKDGRTDGRRTTACIRECGRGEGPYSSQKATAGWAKKKRGGGGERPICFFLFCCLPRQLRLPPNFDGF
jgi:hypothetical protein